MQGKMREGGVDDDKSMVNDVEGVQSLGGREMLSSMREGISVCLVMVAVGVVVLMVVRGVVVLMIVVGVLYIGVVEVDCSGVVDIFMLGGGGESETGGGVCCEASPVVFK